MKHRQRNLKGYRVLVIEDEYFIAEELRLALEQHGAIVVGPVPTLGQALVHAQSTDRIDAAVVDINLCGEMAFPVAEALETRGVPFVFVTGYAPAMIPPRYHHVSRWEKPFDFEALMQALPALMHRS
jgi:DNA-binding NtrC family response regulator